MTTASIIPIVNRFNKDRRSKIDVILKDNNKEFIIRRASDKHQHGTIYYRADFSNCGLANIHNLSATKQPSANLIIDFIKFYAASTHTSVLLYNTTPDQKLVRKALKANDFYTCERVFKNKGSGRGMEFHMAQVK
jgi:hypothetical protein